MLVPKCQCKDCNSNGTIKVELSRIRIPYTEISERKPVYESCTLLQGCDNNNY